MKKNMNLTLGASIDDLSRFILADFYTTICNYKKLDPFFLLYYFEAYKVSCFEGEELLSYMGEISAQEIEPWKENISLLDNFKKDVINAYRSYLKAEQNYIKPMLKSMKEKGAISIVGSESRLRSIPYFLPFDKVTAEPRSHLTHDFIVYEDGTIKTLTKAEYVTFEFEITSEDVQMIIGCE